MTERDKTVAEMAMTILDKRDDPVRAAEIIYDALIAPLVAQGLALVPHHGPVE